MPSTSQYMGSFVPEIWHIVAESLTQKDLNRLCRTSSRFLGLLRPMLYRTVDLEYHGHPEDAIKLLASDKNLAKHVLQLNLSSPSIAVYPSTANHEPIPPYYMEAIQNMTSLKKLILKGSIFNDMSEQQLLVQRLSLLGTPFEFDFTALNQLPRMPGDQFPLTNLTGLTWTVENTSK
jgi:hypothetical protein